MNPQEPLSQNPTATGTQPKDKVVKDTSTKVDTSVLVTTTAKEPAKEQARQMDTSISIAQTQGALP